MHDFKLNIELERDPHTNYYRMHIYDQSYLDMSIDGVEDLDTLILMIQLTLEFLH